MLETIGVMLIKIKKNLKYQQQRRTKRHQSIYILFCLEFTRIKCLEFELNGYFKSHNDI